MTQRKKNALLIIDAQVDFCDPKNGALFVPGAVEDNKRLASFILSNLDEIDYMAATLDSHHLIDIAHPHFWKDKDGKSPNPFTVISAQDVRDGKWTSKFYAPQQVLKYLDDLQAQGEFVHVIWPAHCLIGSAGHAIDGIVFDAIKAFDAEKGAAGCVFVTKGTHPLTEHFGAFRAQVPIPNNPSTEVNFSLLKVLAEYDNVYLAGQAKSHCVANTLKQALQYQPDLAKKFIVLEDCMSSVSPGGPAPNITWEQHAQPIYDDAKAKGVRFSTSVNEKLGQNSTKHALA